MLTPSKVHLDIETRPLNLVTMYCIKSLKKENSIGDKCSPLRTPAFTYKKQNKTKTQKTIK
jgi:hypothetical protein